MSRALAAGGTVLRPRAYRQVKDLETGQWRKARTRERRAASDRFRAQASARLWTGEVVKRGVIAATADDAEGRLQKMLQALVDASAPVRKVVDRTVGQAAAEWLEAPERHAVADSSRVVYEWSGRRWLTCTPPPLIAGITVRHLEPRDIDAWLLHIAVTSGIPTARTARSVLSAVVRYAIHQGWAVVNPVRDATMPTSRVVEAARGRRVASVARKPGPGVQLDHHRAFTAPEVGRVLEAAEATERTCDLDLPDLLAFLAGTGLRLGGALATLWTDLDLDGTGWASGLGLATDRAWLRTGMFTVARVAGRGVVRVAYGTTKASERVLAVPRWLADVLVLRQMTHPAAAASLVFPNPLRLAEPREVSSVTKHVRALLDTVQGDDRLPMMWASSHTFRRTLVTDAHDARVPDRQIAGQTGHRRLAVLQDHYIARLAVSTLAADLQHRAPGSKA